MPYYTINHQTMQATGPLTTTGAVVEDLEDEVVEDCLVVVLAEDGGMSVQDAEDWIDENGEADAEE